jgi:hypothetical protein
VQDDYALFDAGWRCWWSSDKSVSTMHGKRAQDYVEVEVWLDGWKESKLVDPAACCNVANYWWRAAGPLRKT